MSQGQRRLLLLRHAKAVAPAPGAPDASDHARGLSARGRLDAAVLGRLLRERGLIPATALISTAVRTRETFDLLGLDPDRPRRIFSDALYLAAPETLLDLLREQGGAADSVMLVGHNPGMHELALRLAADEAPFEKGFPTCTLALFAIDHEWRDLAPACSTLLDLLHA